MEKKQQWEESSDFANYFVTYGYLYHQKHMLEDESRMYSYYTSIMSNQQCFQDKIVLDVGTGSGILSIWAAQAGAKHVYAIEVSLLLREVEMLLLDACDGAHGFISHQHQHQHQH